MNSKIVAIVGPTASGKSALAVQLAKKFDGEIVSADSRQVYKGLDVGSGKIGKKDMAGVPHHLLDVANPKQTFTAARYKKLAEKAVAEIVRRGKVPIFCGGAGFYLATALGDLAIAPAPPHPKLRQQLEKLTIEELFAKLQTFDPKRAATIDRHNPRRLIRAIEIAKSGLVAKGYPWGSLKGNPWPHRQKGRPLICLKIGLRVDREKLKTRIKKRLRQEIKRGLITEVKRLHESGLAWQRLDDLGLEYRYVSRYLRGLLAKNEMVKKLEMAIWHYAKRQITWFKRDQNIQWVETDREAERLARDFLKK